MFRFEVVVDDKKLGDALRALAGIAHQVGTPQPMVNVIKAANGKLHAETGGALAEMFMHYCQKNGIATVKQSGLKAFLKASGRSPNSVSSATVQLVAAGILKKIGKPNSKQGWTVQHGGSK